MASQNIIDSLFITLGLETSGVEKGMNKAENRIQGGVKNIVKNILAPLAGVFAFKSLVSNYLSSADALGVLSDKLRASISDVQAWGKAVEASGGDAGALQSTLSGIESKLQAARLGMGGGEFRSLGLSIRDTNGNLKTSVDILSDLAAKAGSLNPDRFRFFAQKAGLDEGTIRLLQKGGKEVDALVSKYRALAFTREDQDTARKFNLTLDDLNTTFMSGASIIMRILLPAVTWLTEKTTKTINFLRQHENFVLTFLSMLASIILVKLTPAILAMGKAWLTNPITWIIIGLLLLAAVLDDLTHFVNGGKSGFEKLLKEMGLSQETIETVRKAFAFMGKILGKFIPVFAPLVGGFTLVTKAMRALGLATVTNPVMLFIAALAAAAYLIITNWDSIADFFINLWDKITGAFQKAKDFIVDIFNRIKNAVVGVFGDIINTIKGWINKILGILPTWLKKLFGIDGFKLEVDESINDTIKGADAAVKDAGQEMAAHGEYFYIGSNNNAAEALPAGGRAVSAGNVDNSKEVTIHGGITINSQATDSRGIANDINGELSRIVENSDTGGM